MAPVARDTTKSMIKAPAKVMPTIASKTGAGKVGLLSGRGCPHFLKSSRPKSGCTSTDVGPLPPEPKVVPAAC